MEVQVISNSQTLGDFVHSVILPYNGRRTVYLFCCQILDQTPINQRAFLVNKPELATKLLQSQCEESLWV